MSQLVVRVDDDLVEAVDRLVADGHVESRSDAVRTALQKLIGDVQRAREGAEIVAGYHRWPQSDSDESWPNAATIAMISEEPW